MRLLRKKAPLSVSAAQIPSPEMDFDTLQNTFVLLSNFRSGSHLFKLSMGELLGMAGPAEPFNDYVAGEDGYFFRTFVKENGFDPLLMLSDGQATLLKFMAGFFAHQGNGQTSIIDIKYSQAYRLGVNEVTMNPVILESFTAWKVPIVHLIRRDFVAQAISHFVALQSGVYVNLESDAGKDKKESNRKYWLDPKEVLKNAQIRRDASQLATRQLASMNARVMTVFFEDLVAPDWADTYRKCFRFLDKFGEIRDDFKAPTQNQKSASRVANLEEITDFIVESEPLLKFGT